MVISVYSAGRFISRCWNVTLYIFSDTVKYLFTVKTYIGKHLNTLLHLFAAVFKMYM